MNEYPYISDEDYEIAEQNGISRRMVRCRVRQYGWDIWEAITKPKISRHRRRFGLDQPRGYENFVLTDEQTQIAESNGLDRFLIYKRVRYYKWDLDKALRVPRIPRNERWKGLEV